MEVLKVLLVLAPLLQRSECVRCFARFDLALGQCDGELGEVDEDDCCLNPHSGFQATGGVCQSCGPPVWSPWSPWSECSVLCGDGVTMRRRKCFGIGECEDADNLQTIPCNNTCCNGEGWATWLPWSPCSVSCAGGGVRRKERECSAPPQCPSACSGVSQKAEACPSLRTCPVHGGWTLWSDWSLCSGSCIDVAVPTRRRTRSCSSPAPSSDTAPQGTACPGDPLQSESCSQLPNCPVDGGWGAWSQPGPCSVSCGDGLQLSIRTCDSPAPKYGGRFCDGPSTKSIVCQSPCPVDGFWSGWSVWGECSSSCVPEGQSAVRTRHRSCSNPAPSSGPPGNSCSGEDTETDTCTNLPHCAVDGGWGSWSDFPPCPVTCGVGLQLSVRRCDSPAPKHGGQPCAGEDHRTSVCNTNAHCPVDGLWSQWSQWSPCRDAFRGKDIRCLKIGGRQSRERRCVHRAHNGSICSGKALTDARVCYDVDKCSIKGSWDGWEEWGLCPLPCGGASERVRARFCKPDYSDYRPTIGLQQAKATFFGTPDGVCGPPPEGGLQQVQPCLNVPACPRALG
ncbi:hypothetical protein CgunFtcFv8_009083 [Champsocephalus gunnari]|uniref:Properdin n=1 Tax=Champsocephalus gunnari TaxID=52237 RepID=A0AAN8D193_CHAGU|nr:hypothetical protein CgunFtcFv8_009083 [Champsocephalus gunnari]